jgi:hypothetical protein
MKATELRIGNYVQFSTPTLPINIKELSHKVTSKDLVNFEENKILLEPIPLTEEWLIKFGGTFKSYGYGDDEWKSWNINGESFRQNGTGITFTSGDIDIDYVHELQDLFYVLKKEVKLK